MHMYTHTHARVLAYLGVAAVGVLMSCLMTLLLLCGCGCASRNLRNVCHNWLYIQLQGNVSFALQKLSGRLY